MPDFKLAYCVTQVYFDAHHMGAIKLIVFIHLKENVQDK